MYPMLERNILSLLNHRLYLVTPAEVATSFLQLTHFKNEAKAISTQSRNQDNREYAAGTNFCSDQSLPVLITFYCLSSK
jgi:hypothetical protein